MKRNVFSKLLGFLRHVAGPTYPLPVRLVVCRSCGSDFANPVSWHELDESRWWVRLRCGQCGFAREVEASNLEAESLDADLDRGMAKIAASLAQLDRERMQAESEILAAALERDLVDPNDFAR
jgi:hypothetical protein